MKKAIPVFLIIFVIAMLCFSSGCKKAPLTGAEEEYIEKENTGEEATESTDNYNETSKEGENKGNSDNEIGEAGDKYINDFTLLDLKGEEVSLSDFEGKIVVLNFWATWCPPCKAEIPDFIEICKLYEDRDVQFVGVSVDKSVEDLKKFVNDFNINYPILIDNTIDNVSPRWKISGIPTTFILSKNGKVLSFNVGMMARAQLVKAIEDAL